MLSKYGSFVWSAQQQSFSFLADVLVFTTVYKIYTEWGACKSTQKTFSWEGIGLFETLLRDEIVVCSCCVSQTEERAGAVMWSHSNALRISASVKWLKRHVSFNLKTHQYLHLHLLFFFFKASTWSVMKAELHKWHCKKETALSAVECNRWKISVEPNISYGFYFVHSIWFMWTCNPVNALFDITKWPQTPARRME